jgi:hypothetical protein
LRDFFFGWDRSAHGFCNRRNRSAVSAE